MHSCRWRWFIMAHRTPWKQ